MYSSAQLNQLLDEAKRNLQYARADAEQSNAEARTAVQIFEQVAIGTARFTEINDKLNEVVRETNLLLVSLESALGFVDRCPPF